MCRCRAATIVKTKLPRRDDSKKKLPRRCRDATLKILAAAAMVLLKIFRFSRL
jgi:hypothetical protein